MPVPFCVRLPLIWTVKLLSDVVLVQYKLRVEAGGVGRGAGGGVGVGKTGAELSWFPPMANR